MTLLSRTAPLAPQVPFDAHERPRIMVAEDDDTMRGLLTRVLSRERYEITPFAGGTPLLESLLAMEAGERPHLIISDVRIPGISGFELLEALQRAALRVPVVLISAFCDDDTLDRAARLGAACVLSKPFDMDILRSAALCVLAAHNPGLFRSNSAEP